VYLNKLLPITLIGVILYILPEVAIYLAAIIIVITTGLLGIAVGGLLIEAINEEELQDNDHNTEDRS
jgi:hypothetical protein